MDRDLLINKVERILSVSYPGEEYVKDRAILRRVSETLVDRCPEFTRFTANDIVYQMGESHPKGGIDHHHAMAARRLNYVFVEKKEKVFKIAGYNPYKGTIVAAS